MFQADTIFRLEVFNNTSLRDFTQLKSLKTGAHALLEGGNNVAELMANLPPNLETLVVRESKGIPISPAITYVVENITALPSLKKIKLGWRVIDYGDEPSPRLADVIPGFERSHALKLLEMCKDAGVEMVLKSSKPPFRILHDWYDKKKYPNGPELGRHRHKGYIPYFVEYPYSPEWEELCKEFDCNPATGRQWDSLYPSQITYHYAPDLRQ